MSSPRVRLIGVGQDSNQLRNSSPADLPQSLRRPSHWSRQTTSRGAHPTDEEEVRGSGQGDLAKRPTTSGAAIRPELHSAAIDSELRLATETAKNASACPSAVTDRTVEPTEEPAGPCGRRRLNLAGARTLRARSPATGRPNAGALWVHQRPALPGRAGGREPLHHMRSVTAPRGAEESRRRDPRRVRAERQLAATVRARVGGHRAVFQPVRGGC